MVSQSVDAPAELQRAFNLLLKNWRLAFPTAIVSLFTGLFVFFLWATLLATLVGVIASGRSQPATIGYLLGIGPVIAVGGAFLVALAWLVANATVIHAAAKVWRGLPVALPESVDHVLGKLPALMAAAAIMFLIMLIPAILSIVIIGLPLLLIAGFFLMYVFPAIVLGDLNGPRAIRRSIQLVRANVGLSAGAAVGVLVAYAVAGMAQGIAAHLPIIGLVIAFAIGGFAHAYAALVSARFYELSDAIAR